MKENKTEYTQKCKYHMESPILTTDLKGLNMILGPATIASFGFSPCKIFCLDLVPKVTLLGHVVPHVMITLDHVWSQGLKTPVFEFAGTKYKQKNLQGLK
jgi:hypothetical protein